MEHFKIRGHGKYIPPRRRTRVDPLPYVLPSPKIVPYDTHGGEIVGILPFTLGSKEEIIEEESRRNQNQSSFHSQSPDDSIPGTSASASTAVQIHGNICQNCKHPSIRVLKNIVAGNNVCVGIPTCMNIRCMYISPNLVQLPMPRLTPYEIDREAVLRERNLEDPHRDPILKEYIRCGVFMKKVIPRPPLPLDKKAIEFYKGVSDETFEDVLKGIFDGEVPKIPGVRCLEDDESDEPEPDEPEPDEPEHYEPVHYVLEPYGSDSEPEVPEPEVVDLEPE